VLVEAGAEESLHLLQWAIVIAPGSPGFTRVFAVGPTEQLVKPCSQSQPHTPFPVTHSNNTQGIPVLGGPMAKSGGNSAPSLTAWGRRTPRGRMALARFEKGQRNVCPACPNPVRGLPCTPKRSKDRAIICARFKRAWILPSGLTTCRQHAAMWPESTAQPGLEWPRPGPSARPESSGDSPLRRSRGIRGDGCAAPCPRLQPPPPWRQQG